MLKFWKKSPTPKVLSEQEKQDVKSAAVAIKGEVKYVLENDDDESGYDRISSLMNSIPQDVYKHDKILSYSLSDARKFLGDIDIREKDKDYDDWWREKLKNYLNQLDNIILRNSA